MWASTPGKACSVVVGNGWCPASASREAGSMRSSHGRQVLRARWAFVCRRPCRVPGIRPAVIRICEDELVCCTLVLALLARVQTTQRSREPALMIGSAQPAMRRLDASAMDGTFQTFAGGRDGPNSRSTERRGFRLPHATAADKGQSLAMHILLVCHLTNWTYRIAWQVDEAATAFQYRAPENV